jgi:hypothetical protein
MALLINIANNSAPDPHQIARREAERQREQDGLADADQVRTQKDSYETTKHDVVVAIATFARAGLSGHAGIGECGQNAPRSLEKMG